MENLITAVEAEIEFIERYGFLSSSMSASIADRLREAISKAKA